MGLQGNDDEADSRNLFLISPSLLIIVVHSAGVEMDLQYDFEQNKIR